MKPGLPLWLPVLMGFVLGPGAGGAVAQAPADPDVFMVGGLQVIQRRDATTDVVTARLYLLGGAQPDVEAPDGVEDLWLRASYLASDRALAAAGAMALLESQSDWRVSGFTTLSRYWEDAWSTWANALTSPSLIEAGLEPARRELKKQLLRQWSQPRARADEIAWSSAYRGHPYARRLPADPESLDTVSLASVAAYAQDSFVTSRLLLVVIGDLTRDRIAEVVGRTFEGVPVGSFDWVPPADPQPHENAMAVEDRPLTTSYIAGHVIGPRPGSRDYLAFELATYLLSSRMNAVIREEESLSYAASATFNRAGIPSATIRVSTVAPRVAYPLVLQQMEWLQSVREFRQGDLGWYLDQFVLEELTQGLDPDSQADDLAWAHLFLGDAALASAWIDALRQVTPKDIQRVALQYFPRFQFAYVGDAQLLR